MISTPLKDLWAPVHQYWSELADAGADEQFLILRGGGSGGLHGLPGEKRAIYNNIYIDVYIKGGQ